MVKAFRKNLFFAFAVLCFSRIIPADDKQITVKAKYGINLYAPKDWNRAQPFLNVMKTAREWISQTAQKWDDGRKLPMDENGYVTKLEDGQFAVTLMLTEVGERFPGGEYLFLYDGEGEFEWKGNASLIKAEPGKHLVNVRPAFKGFVQLDILKINPENYPRNMRFVKAEFEDDFEKKLFAPWFIELWKDVHCIRYMDMLLTNNSKLSEWKDRPRLTDRTYSKNGIPIEEIIFLSNITNTNPWINIPHLATDEYIRKTGEMVRDGLKPGLTAYYEFSNEVWNGMFKQTQHAEEKGAELNLAPERWKAGIMFYSKECSRMFDILEQVYKDKPIDSYRKVIASQAANLGVAKIAVESFDAYSKADILAIAPYITFNVPVEKSRWNTLEAEEIQDWTLDQLFDYLSEKALPQCLGWMDQCKALADKYKLVLVAYEGGQHLTALGEANKNKKLVELLTTANRDTRMGEIYGKYLGHWTNIGGDLFCLFNDMQPYTVHGAWGLLEHVGQDPASSPKYMAVKKWADSLAKSNSVTIPSSHSGQQGHPGQQGQ